MKWSTRADWNAAPSRGVSHDIQPVGVTVHWYGASSFKRDSHQGCLDLVKAAQTSAFNRTDATYSDIMYNLAVCWHGFVIECRSTRADPKVRSGANGTASANSAWYAVLHLWGRADGKPHDGLLTASRDAIDWFRTAGDAGNRLTGHRDHVPTECPGTDLYAWLNAGAPRPLEDDMPLTNADAKLLLVDYDAIENKNEPGGEVTGRMSVAKALSNIEATQDEEYRLVRKVIAQLGAVNATVAHLATALTAHQADEDLDVPALVAAVQQAAETGAANALEGVYAVSLERQP